MDAHAKPNSALISRLQLSTAGHIFIRTSYMRNSLNIRGLLPCLRNPQHAMLARHPSHCRPRGDSNFVCPAASALEFDLPRCNISSQRGSCADWASRRVVSHRFFGREKFIKRSLPKHQILKMTPCLASGAALYLRGCLFFSLCGRYGFHMRRATCQSSRRCLV